MGGALALHGAGMSADLALQYFSSLNLKVLFFVDNDRSKIGSKISGIEVVGIDDEHLHDVKFVAITSFAVAPISKQYEEKAGWISTFSFNCLYCCNKFEIYVNAWNRFFLDDESKDVFECCLYTLLTADDSAFRDLYEPDQYFAVPEFSSLCGECIVDAGAFVGDSLERSLFHSRILPRKYYAFEPGEAQYAALKKRIDRLKQEWAIGEDVLIPVNAGVGAKEETLRMTNANNSSTLSLKNLEENDSDSSGGVLQIHSIDEFLPGEKISLIKADMEGMEADLLHGAEQCIRRNKPKMAICVYHLPCDIFVIPEILYEFNTEYRFVLRAHSTSYSEVVCYAY